MAPTHLDAITRFLRSAPSRRDVLYGLSSAGLILATVRLSDTAEAKQGHHKKHKHKPQQKLPSPSPPPPPPPPPPAFNEFGCLDIGQPCQGDSALCCSGICDPGTSTCVGHNSGTCFPDTTFCASDGPLNCGTHCLCMLTTGNATFCADLSDLSDISDFPVFCRLCSVDTDCQEEFGPGAACVQVIGPCTPFCLSTGRTACVPACA